MVSRQIVILENLRESCNVAFSSGNLSEYRFGIESVIRNALSLPVVLTSILGSAIHPVAAQNQPSSAQSDAKVSYFRQIRPVLQRQCQGCHQPASKQAGLLLTSYDGFRSGGKGGPAFLAGKPDQSLVMAYLKGDRQPRMPLGGEPSRLSRSRCFDVG
jgi:hypothetical protein